MVSSNVLGSLFEGGKHAEKQDAASRLTECFWMIAAAVYEAVWACV